MDIQAVSLIGDGKERSCFLPEAEAPGLRATDHPPG